MVVYLVPECDRKGDYSEWLDPSPKDDPMKRTARGVQSARPYIQPFEGILVKDVNSTAAVHKNFRHLDIFHHCAEY